MSHQFNDLRTRPDPPPALLRSLAAALQQYVQALDEATGGVTGLERSVASAVGSVAARPEAVTYLRQDSGSLPTSLTEEPAPAVFGQTD
jgi:hypothetical protein